MQRHLGLYCNSDVYANLMHQLSTGKRINWWAVMAIEPKRLTRCLCMYIFSECKSHQKSHIFPTALWCLFCLMFVSGKVLMPGQIRRYRWMLLAFARLSQPGVVFQTFGAMLEPRVSFNHDLLPIGWCFKIFGVSRASKEMSLLSNFGLDFYNSLQKREFRRTSLIFW